MTSIFGGFVIFSYLGYMAGQLQTEVGKVATHGKYMYVWISLLDSNSSSDDV